MTDTVHPEGKSVKATLRDAFHRFATTLSTPGLLVATLFFAASLTPSLLPRTVLTQGVLSGVSLAGGYALGVFGRWLWEYLELPLPRRSIQEVAILVATVICVATALLFLRRASEWQNSLRALMELPPVDTAHPFRVGVIAILVALVLLALGRLFGFTFRTIAHWLDDHIPRRVAYVAGAILSVALFWIAIDGVLFAWLIRTADTSFQQIDASIEPDVPEPTNPLRAGSARSLLGWEGLGRRGREFVASGPGATEIADFVGERGQDTVLEPIRIYVGLNSAETIDERARLAVEEMERVGGFQRSVLVIATPTGTGWIDPAAIASLEYLFLGDVATVAVQYSYLPSHLSLVVEPEHGEETARAVFMAVYDRWTRMPPDGRPDLYLHGVSLGALNSQRAADLYDVIGDPFAGALWAGPPFRSDRWRTFTNEREPGTPAWLPRFRDGSIVRFMNQDGIPHHGSGEWGPIRILYLQYASDPITFFEQEALYRRPEWMAPPRGPDVSPELRWYPVVTWLQLAVDIAAATSTPPGYGHVFAPEHYVDAWSALADPPGWTDLEIERLKVLLRTPLPSTDRDSP